MVSLNLPKLLVESITEPQNPFLLNCTPEPAKAPYHCVHFPGFMCTYIHGIKRLTAQSQDEHHT